MNLRESIAVVMLAAAGLSACSNADTTTSQASGDPTLNQSDLVDAWGEAFSAVASATPSPLGAEASTSDIQECVGRSFGQSLVDDLGMDALTAAGVTAESVRAGEAKLTEMVTNSEFDVLLLGAYEDCVDVLDMLLTTDGGGTASESARCLFTQLLGDERGRSALATALFTVGDMSAITDTIDAAYLTALLEPCLNS